MESSDRDNFFQTDAAQAEVERKALKSANIYGDPIYLKSKILSAISDTSAPDTKIFVSESSGFVRRVNLETSQITQSYRGPKAPTTCIATCGDKVYAGSWDKDIWSWDIESAAPGRKLSAHTDFVKALASARLSGKDVLISGGADKKIFVWDIETGKRIHTLQDSRAMMMAVQHLVIDPVLSSADELIVVSASSDPHIRRWKIALDKWEQMPESFVDKPETDRYTIEEHETSVYRLLFDTMDDSADLWTASADGTAKCLSRSRNFVTEDTFEHKDYVRAVVVTEEWVITAGRDENVKIWARASGKLQYTLSGHFEEVTDLILLPAGNGQPSRVCSVSIDRTVRTWPLARGPLEKLVEEMTAPPKVEEDKPEEKESLLTAEEEAELAELMDD